MKKILSLVVVAGALAVFTGCDSKPTTSSGKTSTASTPTTPPKS
jgi:hypothetical protein